MTGAQDDAVHQDLCGVDDLHTHAHARTHTHARARTRNDEYEVDLSCHTINVLFPLLSGTVVQTPPVGKSVCV